MRVAAVNFLAREAEVAPGDDAAAPRTEVAVRPAEAILAEAAEQDGDGKVRAFAAAKLTDQAVLFQLARADSDRRVRTASLKRVADQALLAGIAVRDRDGEVRALAAAKLTDQDMLVLIAGSDGDSRVRKAAVAELADQGLLARVSHEARQLLLSLAQALLRGPEGVRHLLERLVQATLLVGEISEADALIVFTMGDHLILRRLTRELADCFGEAPRFVAHQLGQKLDDHIRFEERTLFPAVEATLGRARLTELAGELSGRPGTRKSST